MGLSIMRITRKFPYHSVVAALFAVVCLIIALESAPLFAQDAGQSHGDSHGSAEHGHEHHVLAPAQGSWEGSEVGIAYSEQNHHFSGWMVILMGLAEVSQVVRLSSIAWARLLLPAAMTATGIFLLVWSDHEAWPIGSLGFAETFFGQDPEIVQHKIYGLLALFVGSVELLRRFGRVEHKAWSIPLPLMAIVGGLMLFGHSHGVHPSAHKIAIHHNVMGGLAIMAGSSKLLSGLVRPASESGSSKWEWLWPALLLLIGAQLVFY